MIKKYWKITILIISIIILCTSIGAVYADYILNATQVTYSKEGNEIAVNTALDELYAEAQSHQYFNDRVTALENMTASNADFHNSIFRGKDVTSYYTDGTLYTRISGGEFTDLYVGDYIVTNNNNNNITWRIAGFDIYLGKGDQGSGLTSHHAVIVPDTPLTTSKMNSTDTTSGGYVGSYMYTTTLPSVLSNYITPVFSTHVLEYRNLLTNAVNTNRYNRFGTNTGASSDWGWYTRKLDLMNENQLYGSIVWASSGYDTGSDNVQFPLFKLAPEYVQKERVSYWLRVATGSTQFADVSGGGGCGSHDASSYVYGVRPCFYID